jgi:hypothetical protein
MRYQTRFLLLGAIAGLLMVMLAGGGGLALTGELSYLEGVWLAFNVISTTGFGEGPHTPGGILLSILLFTLGTVHWFGVLVATFELALARSQQSRFLDESSRSVGQNGSRGHERARRKRSGLSRPARESRDDGSAT